MARTRHGVLVPQNTATTAEIPLREVVTTLGRADDCTIVVPLPNVSRLHARIEMEHDRYVLFDQGSVNGTFVNSKRITAGQQLATGDTIWLGSALVAWTFSDPEETLIVPLARELMPLVIDAQARTVMVYSVVVALSPLEYGLLVYLAQHVRKVCTREACFMAVWGQPYDQATCEDALNACIAKLRRNLRAGAQKSGQTPPEITTLQRTGFRLDTEVVWATQGTGN